MVETETMETLLCGAFPSFFKLEDHPYGIRCDFGWFQIIFETCEALSDMGFTGRITEIKEKFAGLKIRLEGYPKKDSKKLAKLIEGVENRSYVTCELCGDKGQVYSINGMILKTMCKRCVMHNSQNAKIFVMEAGDNNGKT